MRIVSLNLRKQLGTMHSGPALLRWVLQQDASLFVAQEPVASGTPVPPAIGKLQAVDGDQNVAAWACGVQIRSWQLLGIPALLIELEHAFICNTYLSAYGSGERRRQLEELQLLLQTCDKPVVLLGDFNLAPEPLDGLYGDAESSWTKAPERAALRSMMSELALVDLTSSARLGEQHYTFERLNRGKWTRFRCDLALASGAGWVAHYDHSVRRGAQAFTDHSACIVLRDRLAENVPAVTLVGFMAGSAPTFARGVSPPRIRPENTAISRGESSKPVSALVDRGWLSRWSVKSILDFGCGRGADVRYLRALGFDAVGFDPHPPFGFDVLERTGFDLVLLLFVLNVLPSAAERLSALRDAARHLGPGGRMLVVARSPREIDREAAARGWPAHADGYISSKARGTFQHGVSIGEMASLASQAGLEEASGIQIPLGSSTYLVAIGARQAQPVVPPSLPA